MRCRDHSRPLNRLLAAASVAVLIGFASWAGLFLPPSDAPPRDPKAPAKTGERPPSQDGLAISTGPTLKHQDGTLFIEWSTSEPADSFLSCGEKHPFERILAKEAGLTRRHRFAIPNQRGSLPLRFHVRSTDRRGVVVSRTVMGVLQNAGNDSSPPRVVISHAHNF